MNTVISQALATGMPVITTKHSGLTEQVIEGKTGFLVDEGDFVALAEKILYFMDHADIWAGLSISGRRHVKENYDAGGLLDEQIRCYEETLGQSGRSAS